MADEKDRHDSAAEVEYPGGRLRLFVDAPLGTAARIEPNSAQAHYLLRVMRARAGESVRLFNGRDGEWHARIAQLGKRSCVLQCEAQMEVQREVPDLWLIFAPIKKTPADYVVQKATELGVRRIQPVFTARTIARRVNLERMRANAIEAAEQSGRLSVPEIREPVSLATLLSGWPKDRHLMFCDESGEAKPAAPVLTTFKGASSGWAVLTGPEGGFDDKERAQLRGEGCVVPVTLGPRIMRADTAALAALTIWQSVLGDWH